MAGGCSIKEEDFEEFEKRFIDYAKSIIYVKPEHQTIDLGINELNLENYNLITSFGPFGENWSAPLFKMRHIRVDSLTYSRDKKHISTSIGNKQKLVYFNYPQEELEGNTYIDVIGAIQKKAFMNNIYLEFGIKEIKPSN